MIDIIQTARTASGLYLQPFISLEEACCDRGFFSYMNVQLLGERNVEAESRPVQGFQT